MLTFCASWSDRLFDSFCRKANGTLVLGRKFLILLWCSLVRECTDVLLLDYFPDMVHLVPLQTTIVLFALELLFPHRLRRLNLFQSRLFLLLRSRLLLHGALSHKHSLVCLRDWDIFLHLVLVLVKKLLQLLEFLCVLFLENLELLFVLLLVLLALGKRCRQFKLKLLEALMPIIVDLLEVCDLNLSWAKSRCESIILRNKIWNLILQLKLLLLEQPNVLVPWFSHLLVKLDLKLCVPQFNRVREPSLLVISLRFTSMLLKQ